MDLKATVHKKGRNLTILIVATWSRVIWMSIYRQRKHCKHGNICLFPHSRTFSFPPRLNKTSTAAKKRFLKHFLHCDSKTAFAHRSHLSKGHIEIKIIKVTKKPVAMASNGAHQAECARAHTQPSTFTFTNSITLSITSSLLSTMAE